MSNTMAQSLSQMTATTFEELALLVPDASPSDAQSMQALDVAVSVDYRGPFNGRLILRVSACVMPTITANMLGEDHAREPGLQHDALGELANVVCGNVLPAIGGAGAVFHLAAPRMHADLDALAQDTATPAARVEFGVDEGRVEAQLFIVQRAA